MIFSSVLVNYESYMNIIMLFFFFFSSRNCVLEASNFIDLSD
jgi:hypothetical protein